MKKCFDLHIHSHYSDGLHSPREIAIKAKDAGLAGIALTDHATVKGIGELALAALDMDLQAIPGVELNSREGDYLGYYLDCNNPDFLRFLSKMQEKRLDRSKAVVELLQQIGFNIKWKDLEEYAFPAIPMRTHIARFLVEFGYFSRVDSVFEQLLQRGKPGFVAGDAPSSSQCIQAIQKAGGIVVETHGVYNHRGKTERRIHAHYSRLVKLGVVGCEDIDEETEKGLGKAIREVARKHALLIVGGSNFHGLNITSRTL
ncbi:MAG: PHP domain-containing protein, partial [Nitrospira sp.]|nr:PHP domain-containing protein [Nitrospira sp.]